VHAEFDRLNDVGKVLLGPRFVNTRVNSFSLPVRLSFTLMNG